MTACKLPGAVQADRGGRSCPVEMGTRADTEGPGLPLGCPCARLERAGHLVLPS